MQDLENFSENDVLSKARYKKFSCVVRVIESVKHLTKNSPVVFPTLTCSGSVWPLTEIFL